MQWGSAIVTKSSKISALRALLFSGLEVRKKKKKIKGTQKNLFLKFLFPTCKILQALKQGKLINYEADSCFETDLHIFL